MEVLNLIAHNQFEFTMTTGLTDLEADIICEMKGMEGIENIVVTKNGRVVVCECDELETATSILNSMGLIEDIGLIKHITTYEPQWGSEDDLLINVTLED